MSEQFSAYYYSFTATGEPGVDAVLRAVAKAGKAYHHTERWADDYDEDGPTQADLIQAAADKAASDHVEALRQARSEGEIEAGRVFAAALVATPLYQQGQRDALAAVEQPLHTTPAWTWGYESGYAQGQRDALAAIPESAYGTDLDYYDYDSDTEYGLAVAREAIERQIKGDSDE